MRVFAAAVAIAWVLFTLGQYDERGTFTLAVHAVRFATSSQCEAARASAGALGWITLDRCVREADPATYCLTIEPVE